MKARTCIAVMVAATGLLLSNSCDRDRVNPLDPRADVVRDLPPTPANLQAQGGSAEIRLRWDTVKHPALAGYAVYRAVQSNAEYVFMAGDGDEVAGVSTGMTTFVDSLLQAGDTYFYRIAAVDTLGRESERTGFVGATARADEMPPEAPSQVSAVADASDPSRVTVRWSAPVRDADGSPLSGLAGYVLLRSEADGSFVPLDTLSAAQREYVDTGLAPLTAYGYRVLAFDAAGNQSAPSSAATVVTGGIVPPEQVAATGGIERITVTWQASAAVDLLGYNIYRSSRSDVWDTSAGSHLSGADGTPFTTGQTTFVDSGLAGGTTWYYRVSAVTESGESAASAYVGAAAQPDIRAPGMASFLEGEAVVGEPGHIRLTWKPPVTDLDGSELTGLDRYMVYRADGPAGPFEFIGSTPEPAYLDTALEARTTYYYQVAAVDPAGNVGPRTPAVAATSGGVDMPRNVRLAASTPSDLSLPPEVTIRWDRAAGAVVRYEVQRTTVPYSTDDADYTEVLPHTVNTVRTDTEVSRGVTYYYRVRTLDVQGRLSAWTPVQGVEVKF